CYESFFPEPFLDEYHLRGYFFVGDVLLFPILPSSKLLPFVHSNGRLEPHNHYIISNVLLDLNPVPHRFLIREVLTVDMLKDYTLTLVTKDFSVESTFIVYFYPRYIKVLNIIHAVNVCFTSDSLHRSQQDTSTF